MRTPRGVFFGLLALSLLPETLVAGQGMPDGEAAAASKVGTVLSALHEEYRSHERLGDETVFVSKDPIFRIVEDRVVIDAVASGETDALRGDLEALGNAEGSQFRTRGVRPVTDQGYRGRQCTGESSVRAACWCGETGAETGMARLSQGSRPTSEDFMSG